MPRQARLDQPGLLHHVISRGIERRSIFLGRDDYDDFLDRVDTCIEKVPNQILAWALMPNHFHFLIRSGPLGIAPLMRRLLTGYATAFNLRHRRAGYLFQNRFKSIVCEEDVYLKELVRYIHLNPIRSGLVKDLVGLAHYPYTGHSALMGHRERKWQRVEEVLSLFGETSGRGRSRYEAFVRDGITQGRRPDLMGGGLKNSNGGEWPERGSEKEVFHAQVLGSSEFVLDLLQKQDGVKREESVRDGLNFDTLCKMIAETVGIEPDVLKIPGRWQPLSHAKAMMIFAGGRYLGKTNKEMAKLTAMAESSASRAFRRGEKLFRDFGLADRLKSN